MRSQERKKLSGEDQPFIDPRSRSHLSRSSRLVGGKTRKRLAVRYRSHTTSTEEVHAAPLSVPNRTTTQHVDEATSEVFEKTDFLDALVSRPCT